MSQELLSKKQSYLSVSEANDAFAKFAKLVVRQCITSQPFDPSEKMQDDHIVVKFEVKGTYGVSDDLFEAVNVLAGRRAPKQENSCNEILENQNDWPEH